MFPYTDPTGTGFLGSQNALMEYRQRVHAWYRDLARLPSSTFTLLEAFDQMPAGVKPALATVRWIGFPRTAAATFEQIDQFRFQFQDEYVEWHIERGTDGTVTRATFTTEFPEYYEALAHTGVSALIAGIKEVIPQSDPTIEELFGRNFDPDAATSEARAAQFRRHALSNPWNNGQKGILFLAQRFNTLGALFNLAGHCAVARPTIASSAVCASVGGFCGQSRNSDPFICEAIQNLARTQNGLSLQDPAGIRIIELQGIWKINGTQVDINDPAQNQGVWTVSRNGRRAELDVTKGVTIGDDPVTTGTQVSTRLQVGATVIAALETNLPDWAKTGQESSRGIV